MGTLQLRQAVMTLSANTVVYFETQSFHREGGSTGSAEQLRVSKRTSGRQTVDLHLANPSSCFLDPVSVSFLLVSKRLRFHEPQSKLTVRASSIFDRFRTDDP